MPTSQFRIKLTDLNLHDLHTFKDGMSGIFRARKDLPDWQYSLPLNWSEDPFNDLNWAFQLHAWRLMDPLLRGLEPISGQREPQHAAFKLCVKIVADWWAYHNSTSEISSMAWNDMACGMRAAKLAYIHQCLPTFCDHVSDEEVSILSKCAYEHVSRLSNKNFIKPNNHGLFQIHGLALLQYALDVFDDAALKYCDTFITHLVVEAFTDEGVHKEHSPAYHIWYTRIIEQLDLPRISSIGGLENIIRRATEVAAVFSMPDGRVAPFGDSASRSMTKPWPDSVTSQISTGNRSYLVADLSASGYAFIKPATREDRLADDLLAVCGSRYSNTHKHLDEMSYIFCSGGKTVVDDSGLFHYDASDFRRYLTSSRAHNTVAPIETLEQAKDIREAESGSFLTPVIAKDGMVRIRSKEIFRVGYSFRRTIDVIPGELLIVNDTIDGDKNKLQSLVHFNPIWSVSPLTESEFVVSTEDGTAFLLTIECDADGLVYRGSEDPMYGWFSPRYGELVPCSCVCIRPKASYPNESIRYKLSKLQ